MLNAAGLAYALVLDSNLRMKGLIRTIVYLPAIISPLIIGYIWSIILSSENGVLLECMKMLGLEAFFGIFWQIRRARFALLSSCTCGNIWGAT